MSNTDIEIVVEDPTAPETNSPAVTSVRVVDVVVCLLLLALALTLGYDNWRTGAGWESTGPQSGYFPFYLSVILAGASLYGLVAAFLGPVAAVALGGVGAIVITALWAGLFPELKNAKTFAPQYRQKEPPP